MIKDILNHFKQLGLSNSFLATRLGVSKQHLLWLVRNDRKHKQLAEALERVAREIAKELLDYNFENYDKIVLKEDFSNLPEYVAKVEHKKWRDLTNNGLKAKRRNARKI